jgi:dipeptidyl aminopeptidase/acylaminoacyl peptidase
VPVNKQFAVLWNYLQNQIAGDLHIVSRTVDNKKWIIAACYDRKPHDFFLFDTEKNELSYLFNSQSKLEKYSFQKMLPVIIKSRDNLDLVSYFTPATGVSVDDTLQASEPKPLIILVHGGPVGVRDSWGFDATTQFLANRGYGVLSINYRGSGGFGKEFIKKSFGQWSLNMQNDLIDGLNWAIAQNITTPDQAIIMGGSYGGYATLVGLTMTPDLFAAGISIVGPSNLQTLLESVPDYWKPGLATLRQYLGLPEEPSDKDAAILAKMSPLTYASQLKKPLLIMQGANDPRVKQSESDQLIAALKEKQIPYLYALFPNEGHGFVLPENRIASFSIIEAFLSEIFKTRSQPSGDALRKSSVIISGLDN